MKIPVEIELEEEVYGKLVKIAESKDMTVEELVIEIITEYLEEK